MKTSSIAGVIFDLDGTIYLGERALPGAVETCAELRRRGNRLLFMSNKPLEPRRAYAAKLTRLGIPASTGRCDHLGLCVGRATWPARRPHLRLYVVGEENLQAELRACGLTLVDELSEQDPREVIDVQGIDAVVVAFDRTLDYRKLNTAYQALRAGPRFFATNYDKTCPMPNGAIPDAGATIAALEHITGRKLELVAGKPSTADRASGAERLGLPPGRCLMVGDRLETDIRMGQEAGMVTALPLTGVTQRAHLAGQAIQPDYVLETLLDLLQWIE